MDDLGLPGPRVRTGAVERQQLSVLSCVVVDMNLNIRIYIDMGCERFAWYYLPVH